MMEKNARLLLPTSTILFIWLIFFLVRTWDIFNSFDCFQLQFETQFFKRKCELNMTTLLQIIGFFCCFFFDFFFTNNAVRTDRSYFKSKFHHLFEVKKKYRSILWPLTHLHSITKSKACACIWGQCADTLSKLYFYYSFFFAFNTMVNSKTFCKTWTL